jgi:hypothetical protein
VRFHRFERLLFDTPTESLQQVLDDSLQVYSTPLLNVAPHNQQYMQALGAFVNDPAVRRIYTVSDSLYRDLGWLEETLGKALQRSNKLCPEMTYDGFYTLITADFQNYDTRVFCYNREMAISIDRYAVGAMGEKSHFGLPDYLVALSSRDYLLRDCLAAAAMDHISLPQKELTLLDYIVYSGKILYFLDQVLPDTPETVKLRYSADQFAWMQQNEKEVWGWLVQKQLLFSTDRLELRNLTGEAPKTNAFGDGSAPRTSEYLGWQIVKAYMAKSGASMSQLFAETDSQKILEQSGWRPGN